MTREHDSDMPTPRDDPRERPTQAERPPTAHGAEPEPPRRPAGGGRPLTQRELVMWSLLAVPEGRDAATATNDRDAG